MTSPRDYFGFAQRLQQSRMNSLSFLPLCAACTLLLCVDAANGAAKDEKLTLGIFTEQVTVRAGPRMPPHATGFVNSASHQPPEHSGCSSGHWLVLARAALLLLPKFRHRHCDTAPCCLADRAESQQRAQRTTEMAGQSGTRSTDVECGSVLTPSSFGSTSSTSRASSAFPA